MKIGSHIKPRSGKPRHVPMFDTEYVFAAVKDKQGQTHFVADVDNADHAEILLKNGAFYAFDKNQSAQPTLSLPRGTKSEGDEDTKPPAYPPEVEAEAKALLDHNTEVIGAEIGKVSGLDVLRCALAIESDRLNSKPRKTVITLLEASLQGAIEAGVKG
jgi:hypothetical protein